MTKAKKSPAQKLARDIQAATGLAYRPCLAQAEQILAVTPESCGDELDDWTCTLRPGPHAGWRHLDEDSGTWWSQSRVFPFSSAVTVTS